METLSQLKCTACRGDDPTLTDDEVAELRPQVPEWELTEVGRIKRLTRVFAFRNFADALSRRKTLPQIKRKVREKAKQAAQLASILQRLHDHPAARSVGAALEPALKKMGGCP